MAIGRRKRSGRPFWRWYDDVVADVKVKSFFEGSIDFAGCEGAVSSHKTLKFRRLCLL